MINGNLAAQSIVVENSQEVENVEQAYGTLCTSQKNMTTECALLRSQLYIKIANELSKMKKTNIEDNIKPVIMALQLPDKEVQLKAILVLGKWSNRSDVQKAARPFLLDSNLLLAYYAACILVKSQNQWDARLAKQFMQNHENSVFHDLKR